MRLNSSGKLGIGTTAPAALLHVKEPSGSTSQIKMSAASNEANYGYLTMTDNTVNTAKLTFGTTYGYNTPVDAMTIFNGNVGIGTTSPGEKLEVKSIANSDSFVNINTTTDAYKSGIKLRQSSNYGFDIYYKDDSVAPSNRGLLN